MKKISAANKNIIITTALALVIFFSGAVAGYFSGSLLRPAPPRKRRPMPPPTPKKIKSMMLERIERRLQLTPDQSKKVAPLVNQWSTTMEALRKQNAPKYVETFNTLFDSIAPIVNKEQLAKLEKMKSEAMEHHKNPMRGGPPREQMGDHPNGPPPGGMGPPPSQMSDTRDFDNDSPKDKN